MAISQQTEARLRVALASKSSGQEVVDALNDPISGDRTNTDTITAHAGGGQTSATALPTEMNRVSVVATAGDSVKLPAATVGKEITVVNSAALSMQVFGQATETINGTASATGVPQLPGTTVTYRSFTAGKWISEPAPLALTNTAISTVGAGVLTGAGIAGGLITRSGSVAAYSDATATAAQIVAAIPGVYIGQTFYMRIQNTVAFPETITAGVGVTLSGQTVIPALSTGIFLVTITSLTAVAINGLGMTSISTMPFSLETTTVSGTATLASGDMEGARFVTLTASGQAAITKTTRTAAQIQANVPGFQVGDTYRLRIVNTNTGTLTTAGGSNVTMTSTIPANHYADYTVTFTSSSAIVATQITVAPVSGLNAVGGVAAGYKVARGVHQQIAASDTIVTGLATVVSVVVSFRDTPTAKQDCATATIGDQAGTPAAGSFLLKTFKSTYAAADDFTDNISLEWVAIGT